MARWCKLNRESMESEALSYHHKDSFKYKYEIWGCIENECEAVNETVFLRRTYPT